MMRRHPRYNLVILGSSAFMSDRPPRNRSTLSSIAVSVFVSVVGGVFVRLLWSVLVPIVGEHRATPAPSVNASELNPRQDTTAGRSKMLGTAQLASEIPGKKDRDPPATGPRWIARQDALKEDYDSLAARFSAIDASLEQRAHDLGSIPIKPEIASALGTCRSDLAAVKRDLLKGNVEAASTRLNRLRLALTYLESL